MIKEITQELTQVLKQYKQSTNLQRQTILLDLIKSISLKPENTQVENEDQALAAIHDLVIARVLIQYVQSLNAQPGEEDLIMMQVNEESVFNVFGNDSLDTHWQPEVYQSACTGIVKEAEELFNAFKTNGDGTTLWTEAYFALDTATAKLSPGQRALIRAAAEDLKGQISSRNTSAQEKQAAYALFAQECLMIFDGNHPTVMKSVFTIFAVVVASLVTFSVGFAIGFMSGVWTGPGAFIAALIGGSAAATALVATTGTSGLVVGAVVTLGLFRDKQSEAVKDYLQDIQIIEKSLVAS